MIKKKIIIDADPGIDDTLAISFAMNCGYYDILGITCVSGNVEAELAYRNVLRLFEFEKASIPVYMGSSIPLKKELVTAKETHGMDGLGESDLPYTYKDPENEDAVQFILESIKKDKEIKIFALGPLTNIAKALMKDRDAFRDVEIVSMGGAFKSHGNCSPVAEFNYWVDPDAADYVLKNYPGKIKILPLDVTRKFVLTPNTISYLMHLDKERAMFIKNITDFYMDFHFEYENIIGSVINDPLTFIADIREDLFEKQEYFCEVQKSGYGIGQLIVDEYGFYKKESNALIYTDIDSDIAMKEFLSGMFKDYREEIFSRGDLR